MLRSVHDDTGEIRFLISLSAKQGEVRVVPADERSKPFRHTGLHLGGFHFHFSAVIVELAIGCGLGNAGAQFRIEPFIGDALAGDDLLTYLRLGVLVGAHKVRIGLHVHAQVVKQGFVGHVQQQGDGVAHAHAHANGVRAVLSIG